VGSDWELCCQSLGFSCTWCGPWCWFGNCTRACLAHHFVFWKLSFLKSQSMTRYNHLECLSKFPWTPIETNNNQWTWKYNAPTSDHICKILWRKNMTLSILEKDLRRNWPPWPKNVCLFKHTSNPPRIVSLNMIIKGLLKTRPKGLEGCYEQLHVSTQRSLAFNKEP
jgi:hypothetical protein